MKSSTRNDVPNVPLMVGPYRLGRTLGIGAFGKVKMALHVITNQKVAIKILNKSKIKHMEMAEKVQREINILKMCTHPHIIRLYEVIDTPSDIFVVMEYVSGGELFDYIVSRGRLPPDEARRFFQQIVSGIEYCHHHRIVHRDLKPENLLIDADNNIKIADFGLSNVAHDGDFLRTSCGSPNYAAPEVISGALYAGPEVDVWSCGVILYALLCGTLPFDDESIPNLFRKIKAGNYNQPNHLTSSVKELISRMLTVDAMQRITIAGVRGHAWYKHKLAPYLMLHPAAMDLQHSNVDFSIVQAVSKLPFPNVSYPAVLDAVTNSARHSTSSDRHQLKVAYDMLLHEKRHRKQVEEMNAALQEASSTPPGSSPRFHSFALSPSTSYRTEALLFQQQSEKAGYVVGPGGRLPPMAADTRDLSKRRRRWYLGIQSKKDPGHVMQEIFKAMLSLNCTWAQVNNYRVVCRWKYTMSTLPESNLSESFMEAFKEPLYTPQFAENVEVVNLDGDLTPSHEVGDMSEIDVLDAMATADDSDSDDHLPHLNAKSNGSGENSPLGSIDGTSGSNGTDHNVLDGNSPSNDDAPLLNSNSNRAKYTMESFRSREHLVDEIVKVGLSLFKVQSHIYLLDFQRVEGDSFGFMKLCAHIVRELKILSSTRPPPTNSTA